MDAVINTALLYITAFCSVGAVMYRRDSIDFHIPMEYSPPQEDQILHQLFLSCPENTIRHLVTQLMVRYTLVFLAGRVVILGPYRTGAEPPVEQLFASEANRRQFREEFSRLPRVSAGNIQLAAGLLFAALYGSGAADVDEQEIDLQRQLRGDALQAGIINARTTKDAVPARRDEMFYYISQIRSGNYQNAIASFRRTMQPRRINSFSLVRTIEGLSSLRTQTYIAMVLAGVSEVNTDILFLQFRTKGRILANMQDAIELGEDMIARACALVRQHRAEGYSTPVSVALDYIHQNLGQHISMPLLAAQAELSPNRLSARFHAEVGLPPMRYLQRERMHTAAELLVYTDLSVQQICASVGVPDSAYFARCFKQEYGVSPSLFRRRSLMEAAPLVPSGPPMPLP